MIYFIAKYQIEGTIASTIKECQQYCQDKEVLGLDIETSVDESKRKLQTKIHKGGLDPYLSKIVLLQIGDLDKQFVIDVRDFTNEELKPITDLLHLNKKITFVGHNLRFECKHLLHKYGILFNLLHDTMICEILLYNGHKMKLGLVDLAIKYLNKVNSKSFNLFNTPEDLITLDEDELGKAGYITPFEAAENQIINKSTRLEFVNIGDKPVNFKQIQYAADDIIDPLLIRLKQREGRVIKRTGEIFRPIQSFNLENKFIPILAECEIFGIDFSPEPWKELADMYKGKMLDMQQVLTEYVNLNHPKYAGQYNMFTGKVDCKIEWSSSKQVVGFFRHLDICPRAWSKQTKRVEFTVGAKELLKTIPLKHVSRYNKIKPLDSIECYDDLILMFLIYKRYQQFATTFGEQWLKYVHPITGRIHQSFVQMVNTGRMASRSPNGQQISSKTKHRDCFDVVPDNKWRINADFSNMEVRCMADRARETYMLAFFNEGHEYFGDDFHSYTATLIERTKYNDDSLIVEPKEKDGERNPKFLADDDLKRGKSKMTTFGLAFGKGAKGLAEDFRIPEEEAEEFMDDYYATYPGLQEWFKEQHDFFHKKGYIVIDELTDFRWFCPIFDDLKKDYQEIMAEMPENYRKSTTKVKREIRSEIFEQNPELHSKWRNYWRMMGAWKRKSQNAPIQGTASRITKVAAMYFREKMIEKGVYIKHVNFSNIVHDEKLIGFTENDMITKEEVGEILEQAMEAGGRVFNKRIIHIAKAEISKKWAH